MRRPRAATAASSSAEYFGQGAILVGTAVIRAEADTVGAIGNVSRATALLADAGKLADASKNGRHHRKATVSG
jgi:hypothetical protein